MAHQGTPRWSAHALRRTASRVLLAVTLPLVTAAPAALAWPQAAAAQTRGTITVEAPTQGASVTSPVTIRGRVSATPAEKTLVGTVYDAQGRQVGQSQVLVASPGPGQPGTFAYQLPFAVMSGGGGRIEIAEYGPPPEQSSLNVVTIPLTLAVPGPEWLDHAPVNWNGHVNPVPFAPPAGDFGANLGSAECAGQTRNPQTEEENQVSAAGWRIFGDTRAAGELRVVSGLTGLDGMCRPMGYQQFVFTTSDGFIGTISPTPMSSREDGSGSVRDLSHDSLTAVFSRYGPNDPACCPSREVSVTYRIDTSAARALLVPVSNSAAPGTAPAPAPQDRQAVSPGMIIGLRGTPHLWVAGEDGLLHWAGDTRALSGHLINWDTRRDVSLEELRTYRIGDPYLSAGLVKIGDPIYLAKWEANQSVPTLYHIQSITDVELFGINAGNYGRFVVDLSTWNQRYGMHAENLRRDTLSRAA
ncbi:MAG TPA: LppP/LprE family lipoprotein [Chloroflexota bacterium]|jgi:hypothetical protein|nr:LppP/LprE family lipoprotein [Chloroflexota bacterium]